MGFLIDLHVHTRRFSSCSRIDPRRIVAQALKAGLDGVVITDHGRQWEQDELDRLRAEAAAPTFTLLAGFEYATSQGDLLVYGLSPDTAVETPPGLPPRAAVERFTGLGATCIAAHPTRAGLSFDECLLTLPLKIVEVASMNLREHEQRLAQRIAEQAGFYSVAASDAHVLHDIGAYSTEFEGVIYSMAELQEALQHGRFRPAKHIKTG